MGAPVPFEASPERLRRLSPAVPHKTPQGTAALPELWLPCCPLTPPPPIPLPIETIPRSGWTSQYFITPQKSPTLGGLKTSHPQDEETHSPPPSSPETPRALLKLGDPTSWGQGETHRNPPASVGRSDCLQPAAPSPTLLRLQCLRSQPPTVTWGGGHRSRQRSASQHGGLSCKAPTPAAQPPLLDESLSGSLQPKGGL